MKHVWSVGYQLYPYPGTDYHTLLEFHNALRTVSIEQKISQVLFTDICNIHIQVNI